MEKLKMWEINTDVQTDDRQAKLNFKIKWARKYKNWELEVNQNKI